MGAIGMLEAFAKFIAVQAVEAKAPHFCELPGNPRRAYFCHGDKCEDVTVPRPDHDGTVVECIDSLVAAVSRFHGGPCSIWHDDVRIVAMLNDTDRRELIAMPLALSQQWAAIQQLPGSFKPKQFILWLKTKMAGATADGAEIPFRSVDFERRDAANVRVDRDRESLGREVHSAVRSDIPETIDVNIRIYSNLPLIQTIRLSIDPDPQREVIDVTPLADEMARAMVAAQEDLHDRLIAACEELIHDAVDVTVIHGCPRCQ